MTAIDAILTALLGPRGSFVPGSFGARKRASKSMGRKRTWTTPHIGAKEHARAKRSRMVATFPNGTPRSAPIMVQASKG